MKLSRPPREEVTVNLTPLIDVVFLLLIFFMVTTTFTKETRLTLTLPSAEGRLATALPDMLEVSIGVDSRYAINGRALVNNDIESIKKALVEVSQGDRSLPLVITADANVPYQAVVTAMDAAGQMGFNRLNMTTKRPE